MPVPRIVLVTRHHTTSLRLSNIPKKLGLTIRPNKKGFAMEGIYTFKGQQEHNQ
jgi:hypothetical protein